jgi:hypothetical protein
MGRTAPGRLVGALSPGRIRVSLLARTIRHQGAPCAHVLAVAAAYRGSITSKEPKMQKRHSCLSVAAVLAASVLAFQAPQAFAADSAGTTASNGHDQPGVPGAELNVGKNASDHGVPGVEMNIGRDGDQKNVDTRKLGAGADARTGNADMATTPATNRPHRADRN